MSSSSDRDPHGESAPPSPVSSGAARTASRRTVLLGAAAGGAGLAVAGLAGCSGSSSSPGSAATGAAGSAGSGGAASGSIVALADVPVGGGVVVPAQKLVVTQPASGTVKAFNSTCTHQNCQVGSVSNGAIVCLCHGSRFSVEDGSVQKGPASAPLGAVPVTVQGGTVVRS